MDENISYDHALEAVDTSVKFQDVPTLRETLQRFPVLQLRASRQLIDSIAACVPNNASEKSRVVRTTADAIGCIVSPCGVLTAECKQCATTLFYGIRDLDECFLQILVKRMTVAKRDCSGCGLFVRIALLETLHQLGKLPGWVKRHFRTGDTEQFETEIHAWKEVLDMLRREGALKAAEQHPVSKLPASSLVKREELRRLRLLTDRNNGIQKKRKPKAAAPFRTSPSVSESRNETQLLLNLVTMFAACPDFVAEKIRARGLKSYCAGKVLSICDSLESSRRHSFTADELGGINIIGSTRFDPPSRKVLMTFKEDSLDVIKQANVAPASGDSCPSNENVISRTKDMYKIWMPLALGRQSFVQVVQQGRGRIGDILNMWTSAEGKFLSSVDQIVLAGLAHERVLEDLIRHCLSAKHGANLSQQANVTSDTPELSALGTVRECFRMLDHASKRGIGYPKSFWEQTVRVFAVVQSAVVWLLLRDTEETCAADVNTVIMHSRTIEERLQDRVEYRRAEPKTNAAVVKVCDCLSVEMKWKDRRRLRSSVWRECRCMIPNTTFLRVPKPDLWFSWFTFMSGSNREPRKAVQEAKKSTAVSRWLYGNRAWRNQQYNYSKLDILHGIARSLLRDDSGEFGSEVEDILAYVLEDHDVRKNIFSEFAKCSQAAFSELDIKSSEKLLEAKLRTVYAGIEKIWSMVGHESKRSLFRLDSAVSSQELVRMEHFLATVAPSSKAIRDCVRDMPLLCEYIAVWYRRLIAQEDVKGDDWRVKIIAGLMWSRLCRKGLTGKDSQRQDTVLEKVMCCFG